MRSGPGTNYKLRKRLYTDSEVRMIGRSGNWIKVRASDGSIGWSFSKFLK